MTDYIINTMSTMNIYYSYSHSVGLGLSKYAVDNLNDIELNEYISDNITHEHIHKVLHELFNETTCNLFDGIEYYFRNDILHRKMIKIFNELNTESLIRTTYGQYIEVWGYGAFLKHYHISENNFNQAFIVCNTRLNNE